MIKWAIQNIPISSLKEHSKNPRQISKEQAHLLKGLIDDFGLIDKPIVNQDMTIIGGHQRVRILKKMKAKMIECWVPDRLLDQAEIDRLCIGLNLNQGSWDFEKLANEWDPLKLLEYGFNEQMLSFEDPEKVKEAEEDNFDVELPVEAKTKMGDIYELGRHRLICGSATKADDIRAILGAKEIDIVITDPPYNVGYEGSKKKRDAIKNDNMSTSDFAEFLGLFYKNAFSHMKNGAVIYVFHADTEGENFRNALHRSGLKLKQCLIWKKSHLVLGHSDYHWKHEPILYAVKEGEKRTWNGDRSQTTILEFDKPNSSNEHPTMKSVPLIGYLLKNSSNEGELVFDFFLGSGSTLMACEQLNRVCFGTEIEPKYCDVIVNRYRKYKMERDEKCEIKLNGEIYDK